MKIMLDTNVLISAFVFHGKTGELFRELLLSQHELYVSEFVDKEFYDKLRQKWPEKADIVYRSYHSLNIRFCKSTKQAYGISLRDPKDIPVLNDALAYGVDVLLSGDKDFSDANIKKPIIINPTLFYEFLKRENPNSDNGTM